jgi:aminoglycoside phosphotransferase (APT) family kinase protein
VPTSVPSEVDDLTPAFFTYALGHEVEQVTLVDRHSGTTGRVRVALRGAAAVPATVFVKLPPFEERQRAFVASVGMGVTEARFYRDLASEVPVRVPRAWFADTDGERYVMVLEDLTASRCRFPAPTDDDIAARALDIVEQLAALHAQFWDSPRFEAGRERAGDLAWLASRRTGDAGGGATFVRMAVDSVGDQLDASFHRIADVYLARAPEIVALWNRGALTLVHGDPHLGNLFVDERAGTGGRTGFLDWAMIGRSPGVRDVAYVLCNSVPAEVRASGERAWLARYCEVLGEAGISLSFDDAWQQYRLFAIYSWVAATSTAGMGSKWQPLHVGLGGTQRATEACTQLESVDLLEEMLSA